MKSILFFLFFIVAVISVLSCTERQDKTENEFDSFINKKGDSLYKSQKVPGIFIGVLNNGKRKYYDFGYADPDKKIAFDSATLFEIGSITKTFTAYVLENVLKERSISDSSAILQYLPDSVQANKALEKISFLSLMNHTSGLPRLPDNLDLITHTMAPYDYYTAADLYSYLKSCTPEPDGESKYSNLGAGLGGVLAQRISGKTYDALLNEYIFLPFKITPHPDESIAGTANKAQGYFENTKSEYWKAAILAPAGTLKCSASEMLTYFQYMSNPINDKSKQIVDKLLEPTITIMPAMKVCRAWHTIEEKDNPVIYWHDGGTYGFSTFGAFIKEENKAVIVVVNQFNKNEISQELGIQILKKMIR